MYIHIALTHRGFLSNVKLICLLWRPKVMKKCVNTAGIVVSLYLDIKQVICKYWLPVYSGPAFQYCMELLHGLFALSLATSTGPFCLHGNPFLMSAYLHIRTAQREREGERQSEKKEQKRGSGRRNQTMPSPQGPSMMQLSPPFDTLTKEGQT